MHVLVRTICWAIRPVNLANAARPSLPSPPAHRYEEVSDLAKLTQLLEEYLDEYNLVNTNPLNLGE